MAGLGQGQVSNKLASGQPNRVRVCGRLVTLGPDGQTSAARRSQPRQPPRPPQAIRSELIGSNCFDNASRQATNLFHLPLHTRLSFSSC